MSEGRRAVHPQEPAEGSEEDVEAPGIEESRDDLGTPDNGAEERSSAHPQEPAEGGVARSMSPAPTGLATPPSGVPEVMGLLEQERVRVQAGCRAWLHDRLAKVKALEKRGRWKLRSHST